jgi:hypothetical protein
MPASIASTQLVAAVSAGATKLLLKSVTNLAVGWGIFIDREYYVCNGITGTIASVRPGGWGTRSTSHAAGARAFYAPPDYFTQYDREGQGVYADQAASPYINVHSGIMWSVLGGKWVANNTYGGSTNYGLSPAIWDDCPLDKMLVDPGYGQRDFDDFNGASGSPFVTAHKYALAGANGTFTAAASFASGAVLTAPGTDNDEAYLIGGAGSLPYKLDAASTWWYEARVKISQITTAQGVFVGLTVAAAADLMTDDTMAMKSQSILGFQILAATDIAAVWQSMMMYGGTRTAINATAKTATTTYVKLGMKSVAGVITFYVDGVPDATGTLYATTGYPIDVLVAPVFATKCGTAAANVLTIDWVSIAQTRIAN